MHNWPQQLAALGQAHRECVIVTVAGVRGSAPREVGSKMLVTESNQSGMIGGGYLENECTRQARELLGATDAPHRKLSRFALGSQCGQCCGGVVDILFERVATNAAWVGELAAHQAAGTACLLISHRRTGDIPIKHVLTAASMELPGLDRRDVTRLTRHHGQLMQRGAHVATLRAADGEARDVLIEPVDKAPLNLIIFGGGHVGRACT
ncbi:MAG: XdhC family protein, partial [Pseudomonadota bacterium]